MPDDLGGRLTRAGLVTRADLAEIVASAPPHDAALVRSLVRRGLPEDALAGFFLSEGFGPLLEWSDLDRAEPAWAARVPSAMAIDFLALPLRAVTDGVVVAMAAPSDAHIVRELARVLGSRVLATVARPSEIERRVRALHPEAPVEASRQAPSEPPILELTRRRPSTTPRGFDAGFRAPDGTKEAKLGPRLALSDDEVAMPLVRQKPSVAPAAPPPPSEPPASATEATLVTKTFARPETSGAGRTTLRGAGPWARGEPRRSNTQPLMPAISPDAGSAQAIHVAGSPASAATPAASAAAAPATAASRPPMPATSLEGALADLAERVSDPGRPAAETLTTDTAAVASAARAASSSTPAASPSTAAAPPPQAEASAPAPAEPATPPKTQVSAATAPMGADERWDLPSQPPAPPIAAPSREPANKLSSRATADLPTIKAAPGDIGQIVAAMRGAKDRDDVVRLACEGATSVARAAVFFALRKGVLKGWDGAGPGVRRDSVRNLWIPTSSASTFKKVLETKSGSVGPYGTSVADGLFRAAVGSRGGDLMVQPVVVAGKVVGMLCVDDLRPGPLGAHRIEVLCQTVGDAFVRIISAGKD